jgi:hypothetical protein
MEMRLQESGTLVIFIVVVFEAAFVACLVRSKVAKLQW